MDEKIEETIMNICDWIDSQLPTTSSMEESAVLPMTISALAELVKARAGKEE